MSGLYKVFIENELDELSLSVSKGPKGRDPVVIMPKTKKKFLLLPTFPDDKLIVTIKGNSTGKFWIKVSDLIFSEPYKSDITMLGDGPSWIVKIKPSSSKLPLPQADQSVTIGEDEPGR